MFVDNACDMVTIDSVVTPIKPFKMDPEVKANWLKALRSGEYEQGRSLLYNAVDGKYCCLGVLAKINNMMMTTPGDGLVDDRQLSVGYKPFDEMLGDQRMTEELWHRNDGYWKNAHESIKIHTFLEIADFIETNL